MMEITKGFGFDAAHTLHRDIDAEPSRRVHGHSYRAEVALRGRPDPRTGMIMDMGHLARAMEQARDGLDHRFLDEVDGLGPATLESLAKWIWERLEPVCVGLVRVTVYRDSAHESCSYWGETIHAP